MQGTTEEVTVGSARLGVRENGASGGPPVVALHGLASSARTWDAIAGRFATAGRRVVAVEQRGHGRSTRGGYSLPALRDDVLALLDRLGLERVDLLGHSMGGRVAVEVTVAAPERVRRMVLEDTPTPSPGAAPPRRHGVVGTVARNVFALSRLRTFDPSMARAVIAEVRAPDPAWWDRLPGITASTLLVHGGGAGEVPCELLARMERELPDARTVTIEAGHRVHSKRPEEFAAVVVPFLS